MATKQAMTVLLLLLASIWLGLLQSCSTPVKTFSPEYAVADKIWPAQPAKPRIAYGGSFSTPEQLGIEKSFFRKVVEFFSGEEHIMLVQPMAITVDRDNVIYVADPGVAGIHRFDVVNNEYKLISRVGGKPLKTPVAFAQGFKGEIYFTDSSLAKVFVIKKGNDIAEEVEFGFDFKQPTGIAFDPVTGWLYVVDTARHLVTVFDKRHEFIRTFGQRGKNKGEFNFPTMIWVNDKKQVLVSDSLNFRVQLFQQNGKFISSFGQRGDGTGQHARPKGIAEDRYGHIYVADALFHTIQVFDHSGHFLMNFGQQGQQAGRFWLPSGIFVRSNDAIFVADTHNHRVQVFYYIGERS